MTNQPNKQEWEERFKKEFRGKFDGKYLYVMTPNEFKAFIESELSLAKSEARKQGIEEALKVVKGYLGTDPIQREILKSLTQQKDGK